MESTQLVQNLDFKIFEGPTRQQMPTLIAAGYVPASAAQIMHGRLEGKLSFDKYYDSGDAIVYHPDGRVKLVWDSQDLRRLDPKSSLRWQDGALVLPDVAWKTLDGEVFSWGEIVRYTSQTRSKGAVVGNPFWQWLARDTMQLLGAYADQVFSYVKSQYDLDEAMGVHLDSPDKDALVLRLWCLGDVDDCNGSAYGSNHLDLNVGCLAGVLETQGVSRPENHRGFQ